MTSPDRVGRDPYSDDPRDWVVWDGFAMPFSGSRVDCRRWVELVRSGVDRDTAIRQAEMPRDAMQQTDPVLSWLQSHRDDQPPGSSRDLLADLCDDYERHVELGVALSDDLPGAGA